MLLKDNVDRLEAIRKDISAMMEEIMTAL